MLQNKNKAYLKSAVLGNGIYISHGGKVSKAFRALNFPVKQWYFVMNLPLTETLNITVYIIRKTGIFLNLKI